MSTTDTLSADALATIASIVEDYDTPPRTLPSDDGMTHRIVTIGRPPKRDFQQPERRHREMWKVGISVYDLSQPKPSSWQRNYNVYADAAGQVRHVEAA